MQSGLVLRPPARLVHNAIGAGGFPLTISRRTARELALKVLYQVDVGKGDLPEILDGEGGFIWSHWCGSGECEERVKDETKATIRNIPRESPAEEGKCIKCGSRSERRVIFARAY